MKINERHRAIFEWCIAVALVFSCCKYSLLSYGNFTAIKAHKQSERTFHYGPSDIIKTIDLNGGKIYLCKYKDWFSADTVKKGIIKWYPGDQVGGYPIDHSKKVSYSWGNSHIRNEKSIAKVFGYVNDPDICQMIIVVDDNNKDKDIKYDLDSNRMFIFYWNESEHDYKLKSLKGLDKQGKVLYEEKI